MIIVVQRVKKAKVLIDNKTYSQIDKGYAILVGFCQQDKEEDVIQMAQKIANLRVMADVKKKMNLSIIDVKAEILLVSQFTLCADTSQRRPSFLSAKNPKEAKNLYKLLIKKLQEKNIPVKTGKFGHYMTVEIVNDGPVTIIMDSKKN